MFKKEDYYYGFVFFPGGLHIEKEYQKSLPRSSETATEDAYIRKFISGTYQFLLLSEPIIKRRGNMIVIAFLVKVSVKRLQTLYAFVHIMEIYNVI